MYFSCNVSFASLPLFLPTIISQMGTFTQIQSNGLSAPPYVFCFFVILAVSDSCIPVSFVLNRVEGHIRKR